MKDINKLMGLKEEYRIEKVEEEKINGVIIKNVYIKKTNRRVQCPYCKKYTSSVHDRLKPIKIKHIKAFEYQTYLVIRKRRFICHKCNKKFTEEVIINNKNKTISNQLEQKILRDLLSYNLSLKYISENNNVNDVTVRNILKKAMNGYPKKIRLLPRIISFDEFKADTKEGKYAFIINDPIHKKVLDILPNRKKEYLMQYFTYCENRHSVEFVISDMYEPYLLVARTMFPKAKYVVDRFHYIRYVMEALDNIRIRLQKDNGYNSKIYRMLKNKKNVSLLRKYSNDINWFSYTTRYKNKHVIEILNYDLREELLNIDKDLRMGYELKELFLDIINHATYEDVKIQLINWIELCKESKLVEFVEASSTIDNWLEYITNSFIDNRLSNGYTEGVNNKIKVIKRVGFGYKNFSFFRLRLLYILNNKITIKMKKDDI